MSDYGLDGKIALVTGAGRSAGLGFAIARALASEGAQIVLHDLAKPAGCKGQGAIDELNDCAADLRAAGARVTTINGDMRREDDVEALVAHAVNEHGALDILVNNAGVGTMFGPLVDATQEQWDTVLDVNLRGPFFAMKHAARRMLAQPFDERWGRGRIVSIASKAAKVGSALTSSYVASKHGLVGLTRSVAVELGPQQITVNSVCPNHVTTDLGSWQNDYMAGKRGLSVANYLDQMRARIPLGRVGEVEDTADAVTFLCSSRARYITGEAMNVSGGEAMH